MVPRRRTPNAIPKIESYRTELQSLYDRIAEAKAGKVRQPDPEPAAVTENVTEPESLLLLKDSEAEVERPALQVENQAKTICKTFEGREANRIGTGTRSGEHRIRSC